MSKTWHILDEGGSFTLARRLPARFDVAAQTRLPVARKDRLARQIRQDMWRALRDVRGFSPVVRISDAGSWLEVTAGGGIDAKSFPRRWIESRISEMLENPAMRARWIRWAA